MTESRKDLLRTLIAAETPTADVDPDAEALLGELIFELANPELTSPLTPDAAAGWLQRIRAAAKSQERRDGSSS